MRGVSVTNNGVLPALNGPSTRGVSPNVAKRAAWSTPRDRLGTKIEQQQSNATASEADGGAVTLAQQGPASTAVTQLEDALEVLDAVLSETDDQSDSGRRREAALEETSRLHAAEERELERTRLAVDEQMQTTLELLQTELARERRRNTSEGSRSAVTTPATARKGPGKHYTRRLTPRLRNSPLKPRSKEPAPVLVEDREAAEEGNRPALFDTDISVGNVQGSLREEKLQELREERARWQRDYETMREQVIEEKARQVALFQRLQTMRQSHTNHLNDAKAALCAAQADVERLHTRQAQARISAVQEARRTAALIQTSRAERQRLVCALAETRHKFREWKEGEAATLRATREQAVHALHTEYELKLARHQEEKQKLRDKVKDLEVSLRLLQRDRQMSPGELSERKGTLLRINASAIGLDVGAADFIEAQGRIHELEALLQLSKERQERQDMLLRVSERALARLGQERELDALENLSFPSPAVALALSNGTGQLQVVDENGKHNTPEEQAPLAATDPPTPDVVPKRDMRILEREGSMISMSPPSTPNRSISRRQSTSSGGIGADMEKELLRRKSMALSAEVNRYQKIVVQSMEEVRALKESRRRSRSGSLSSSAMVLSPREAYLLEELAASQHEIDAMKAKLRKRRKKEKMKAKAQNEAEDPGSCSSNSSDCDYISDSSGDNGDENDQGECSDTMTRTVTPLAVSRPQSRMTLIKEHEHDEEEAAVRMIQTCSRGFLARREFIRKKLAIGKIKARYRGYLVRKNYEALGGGLVSYDQKLLHSQLAPHDFLLVTAAMQYKMQIVEPHHKLSYVCEGGGCSEGDNVDVVLRVSKDPPILQVQVTPDHARDVTRVAYFHLFEIIALLPFEDEELVLESSSENEIARIFASRLIVQGKGSENDYRFYITRPSKQYRDGLAHDSPLAPGCRALLMELPVQPIEPRTASASSDAFDTSLDGTAPMIGHEGDLDLLIREARKDPMKSGRTHPVSGNEADDATTTIRRLVDRLSNNSFEIEE
ncbi:hypothetical protein PHMEG_0005207 [Phytophthora megakarya]|uniref:Uncharacterized protein n=1 Tax=Phytophthora megakarya TaxID=4795 RepID=A0A225WRX7_9STRA|nr:hypothetical protein PHMEG_0005207 [Phytophthora megakarya]